MEQLIVIVGLLSHSVFASIHIEIDFIDGTRNMKKLPRFWESTGFSPPEPIEHASDVFESDDVNLNLEIIGSLPNTFLNVRMHWLLNLLTISNYSAFGGQMFPIFNFDRLDNFLWKLSNDYRLKPTIEFMTTLKFKIGSTFWETLAATLVSRLIGVTHFNYVFVGVIFMLLFMTDRYGVQSITKWKFETWNEPDLLSYNRKNFTEKGFKDYLMATKRGIKAAEREYSLKNVIKLRGPAGLFKKENKHKFCWGILASCNKNLKECPIDVITFHRKGDGDSAQQILNNSFDLLANFSRKFPNLKHFKYSNTEADPIKKWSEPRDFQADSRYAVVLVETVLEHWQALYDGRMNLLDSISHDNAFIPFYPNFFTQRTLLARFQMNNTTPKHIQFVQKPVFSALGLLANLGTRAGKVNTLKEISFVITKSKEQYSCILLWSHVDLRTFSNKSKTFEIKIRNLHRNESSLDQFFCFVEAIDNKQTNPWLIFKQHKNPPFPDINLFEAMRNAQNPIVLNQTTKVSNGKIILNFKLLEPFVVLIRVCSKKVQSPRRVKNLRLRKINSQEIIIFWSDSFYRSRCIKTYEIFFKHSNEGYKQIEPKHIPFMYYQLKHTISGCFKIRSKDIFNRAGKFSREICYDGE